MGAKVPARQEVGPWPGSRQYPTGARGVKACLSGDGGPGGVV